MTTDHEGFIPPLGHLPNIWEMIDAKKVNAETSPRLIDLCMKVENYV